MKQITLYELFQRYPIVGNASEGFVCVGLYGNGGQFFHVRQEDGQPAYQERFDCVESFCNGLARVEKNGESFYINTNGERVD